ncbi:hypothetical protein KJ633_04255 [bacterium]|nr:methyl-accepting chemotaxis protein [bacterium]MBU3955652.1 hypothetical protein [bacterium]
MTGPKRRIVLNKNFQVKYALMIGGSLMLLMAISMFFTYSTIKPLFPNILSSQFAGQIKAVQMKLLISGLVYTALIVYMSFYISHRIAGPIFRIEKDIRHLIEENNFNFRFKLREKDELQELAGLLNELMDYMRGK